MGFLDPYTLEAGQNPAASVEMDFFQNFQNVSGRGLSRPRPRVCADASEFLAGVLLWACQKRRSRGSHQEPGDAQKGGVWSFCLSSQAGHSGA